MCAVFLLVATAQSESELTEASSKSVQFEHVVETVRLYTPSNSNLAVFAGFLMSKMCTLWHQLVHDFLFE